MNLKFSEKLIQEAINSYWNKEKRKKVEVRTYIFFVTQMLNVVILKFHSKFLILIVVIKACKFVWVFFVWLG